MLIFNFECQMENGGKFINKTYTHWIRDLNSSKVCYCFIGNVLHNFTSSSESLRNNTCSVCYIYDSVTFRMIFSFNTHSQWSSSYYLRWLHWKYKNKYLFIFFRMWQSYEMFRWINCWSGSVINVCRGTFFHP